MTFLDPRTFLPFSPLRGKNLDLDGKGHLLRTQNLATCRLSSSKISSFFFEFGVYDVVHTCNFALELSVLHIFSLSDFESRICCCQISRSRWKRRKSSSRWLSRMRALHRDQGWSRRKKIRVCASWKNSEQKRAVSKFDACMIGVWYVSSSLLGVRTHMQITASYSFWLRYHGSTSTCLRKLSMRRCDRISSL